MRMLLVAWMVLSLLVAVPAPARAAETYEEAWSRGSKLAQQLLGAMQGPEAHALSTGDGYHVRAVDVAVKEVLRDRVIERYPGDYAARALTASLLIDVYLQTGLEDRAIALLESLDDAERVLVIAGPVVAAATEGDVYFSPDVVPRSTAIGLAMAYADVGKSGEADRLLQSALRSAYAEDAHDPFVSGRVPAGQGIACARTLLRADPASDWFEWVFSGCARASPSRAYTKRAAAALAASSLPANWRSGGIEPNEPKGDVSDSDQEQLDAALAKLPELRQRIERLRRDLAAADARDARWIVENRDDPIDWDAADDAPASDADRALAKRIEDRLNTPLWNPYRMQPAVVARNPAKTGRVCSAEGALRCAERRGVRWVLYGSSDYDPTGEVPAAGYWLRRIDLDTQAERTFYLGINQHRPYELADPDVPIVVGGELRLRVRRAEIDPEQVSFPPIDLEFQRSDETLELRASVDDVALDGDADGLTDLAEAKLLLDPELGDTDGDGLSDAVDAMPNVAFQANATPRAEAMAAALNHLGGQSDGALSVLVPGSAEFAKRQSSGERTQFVVVDPADVAGLASATRIIVLPRSLDLAALRKRAQFAFILPMAVSLRFLSDGSYAEVSWSSNWSGGKLALHRRAGRWRVGVLEQWVT